MFSNELKVKIEENIMNFNTKFFLYYESDKEIYVVQPLGEMSIKKYEGENVDPTFTMNTNDTHSFLKEMAELAEKRGILTDSQLNKESKTVGVIESTKYHLEDMRKLVFKEKAK